MKYLAVLLLGAVIASCGGSTQSAVEYNDKIIKEQIALDNSISAIFMESDVNAMETQYKKSVDVVNKTKDFAKELDGFDGSTEFKDAFVKLVDEMDVMLKTQYNVLIENLKIPDEEYTTEDEDQYNEIATLADEKYEEALDNFISTQESFSKKYNFQLVEKDL